VWRQGNRIEKLLPPRDIAASRQTLYHNNGDGNISDRSKRSGVGIRPGKGWVCTFDDDNDGWQDIFITNDSNAEFPVP